jgi:hypothetical protein
MRRDNTNPSKVSSSRGILKVVKESTELRGIGPLPDDAAVAVLAGDSPDLSGLVVVVNREPSSTSRYLRIGHRLAAEGALSTL